MTFKTLATAPKLELQPIARPSLSGNYLKKLLLETER